jgi:hypothetical protein
VTGERFNAYDFDLFACERDSVNGYNFGVRSNLSFESRQRLIGCVWFVKDRFATQADVRNSSSQSQFLQLPRLQIESIPPLVSRLDIS